MSRHVIASIPFPPGQESGTLECTCGAVMDSTEFNAHRRTVNAPGRPNGADYASGRVKSGHSWRKARTPGQHAFGTQPIR